jgi:PAS domain S-box-containing protein
MSTNSNATLGKVTLDPKNEAIKPPQKNEYKALFDSMSEMVEVIELIYNKEQQPVDFYIRDVNISFAKLLNKTKEELIDKRITSVIGIIEDYWLTSFATVDKTGEPLRFKSYGAEFDKYYFVSVWKIREGRIGVSFTCITESEKAEITLKKRLKKEKSARNKTEQKLTEKSLELQNSFDALRSVNTKLAFQNEEKDRGANSLANIKVELEQQVTCLNQAAIVSETDASGTLIFVNDNFCKIFGYQRKELIGKSHAVIKSGKNSSNFIANMWKTISTGKVWKDEIINKAKGNKKFIWLDMTITPFKDIHGNIVKYVGIQFDITAQIKQKKALLKQAEKLALANSKLAFQNKEKDKRVAELAKAMYDLSYQNEAKDKRSKEFASAKEEKEKRADELALANAELAFQNKEKDRRSEELLIAKEEKEKRAHELTIANKELAFQNKEKEQRATELVSANIELAFQNEEKEKRADELALANAELAFQNKEKDRRSEELLIAKEEKEKRAHELTIANKELAFQNKEKEQRATELVSANIELAFQNEEKEKRVQELAIAKELRQFIETSSTPIFGIDHIGLINEWNQASQKVTGYQKEEVLGIHWKTFTPAKSEKKASSVLNLVLEGKQTENFEFSIFSKDKNQVILLVNSSARRDTHGKITGVLAVGQDITELVGYRNELEIKVKERTVKLNEALEKQKELNELKSKFVSTASHEFRTPLTAINFAAGSIKKYWGKMEPNLVEKKLYKIENQVLHMTRLLDDVLMVGQAGAGELKNNPTDVYLGDFINEIIEEVSISREQSHQIDVLDPEDLKKNTVFIDKKLGRNIFINLISNAVKYSANSKKIVIQFSSNKKYIIISVTDFGIGISNTELKTIFNPFSRGKNVDLIQGTGLGLSIVKEAITAMQGKILVNSSIGKGTTFITKLPKTK